MCYGMNAVGLRRGNLSVGCTVRRAIYSSSGSEPRGFDGVVGGVSDVGEEYAGRRDLPRNVRNVLIRTATNDSALWSSLSYFGVFPGPHPFLSPRTRDTEVRVLASRRRGGISDRVGGKILVFVVILHQLHSI